MRPAGGTPAARDAVGTDATARLIRTLTITIFLQWLGATAIIPMLPVYIRHLGGTDLLAGLVMASFFAAGVLLQYPMGRLADRVGRRPVLIGGLVVYSAASFAFLLPIVPAAAIALRGLQGAGAGAGAVAALALVSGAVPAERRGRAFAAVYGGEVAGMAVGPLIGSILGAHHMDVLFLGSGVVSLVACVPALRISEPVPAGAGGPGWSGRAFGRLRLHRSLVGAVVAAAALGLTTGVYDICWTLLLLGRGATGWQIGVSWTLFAVPFVAAARPSGWLADHVDRRALVLAGLGAAAAFCASYPFIHSVPLLITLGGTEAFGFAAAMPAMQSLLTQGSDRSEVGRVQGLFGTVQTASTAVAAAAAGAAYAVAVWLPFLTAAVLTVTALAVASVVWLPVEGRVHPRAGRAAEAAADAGPAQVAGVAGASIEVQ